MANDQQVLTVKILAMFQKYGIRSVTTDDISKELGISKKTLYEQFKDKSQIVELTVELMTSEIEQKLADIRKKEQNAIISLLEIYSVLASFHRSSSPSFEYDLRKYFPDIYTKIFDKFEKCIYDIHVENIIQGQKEGVYRDVNADVISRVLSHRMQAGAQEIFTNKELSTDEIHKELFLYHLYGICNARGFELANSYLDDFYKSINLI